VGRFVGKFACPRLFYRGPAIDGAKRSPFRIAESVIRQSYFDLVQFCEREQGGTWSTFAEMHFSRIVEPWHLQRSLDLVQTLPRLDDPGLIANWLEDREQESAAIPDEARQRLFDSWFEGAYAEEPVGGSSLRMASLNIRPDEVIPVGSRSSCGLRLSVSSARQARSKPDPLRCPSAAPSPAWYRAHQAHVGVTREIGINPIRSRLKLEHPWTGVEGGTPAERATASKSLLGQRPHGTGW
jgi:hypothetical protein